jgi:hypothetical protein
VVVFAFPDAAMSPEVSSAIRTSFPEALIALHTSVSPAFALAGSAQNAFALQPAASFPSGPGAAVTSLRAVFAVLEGGDEMVRFGVRLADLLEIRPFRLPLTASGCTTRRATTSNFTAATLCAATDTLQVSADMNVGFVNAHQGTIVLRSE